MLRGGGSQRGGRRGGHYGKPKSSKEKADQMNQQWRPTSVPPAIEEEDDATLSTTSGRITPGEGLTIRQPGDVSERGSESLSAQTIRGEMREVDEEDVGAGMYRLAAETDGTPRRTASLTAEQDLMVVPRGDRKTKYSGVLWRDQVAGVVVQRLDVGHALDPDCKEGDEGVIIGPDGRLWITKWRYFIILRQFTETVAEIPIYTCGDKGLMTKPPELHREYMSVKPLGVAQDDFVNQSPANPILDLGEVATRGAYLDGNTMVARFNEIATRSLDCDELFVTGRLTADSTKTLLECAYQKAKDGAL